jgi:hypothetical protein
MTGPPTSSLADMSTIRALKSILPSDSFKEVVGKLFVSQPRVFSVLNDTDNGCTVTG